MLRTGFQKYILPGLVFQSITVAGGYGTGRELVEFFLRYGPLGGIQAMVLSTSIWCVVCALTFELARQTRSYDYRSFCRQLLGRSWGLYEICYLTMMILILAVIAASSGSILEEIFSLPYELGVLSVMALVGLFVFKGTSAIERFVSLWSLVLYANYIVLFLWCFSRFGGEITTSLSSGEALSGWIVGGIKYGANNIGVVPAVLFSIRHIETRKEALIAGVLAGPLGIIPGLLFFLAMIGQYPSIVSQTIPSNYLLDLLGSRTFQIVFQIVLVGTLIETGAAMIHAVNERIDGVLQEKKQTMPSYARPIVAVLLLVLSTLLARFGLTDLIARGYGTVAWGFLLFFVIPVLTLGTYKVVRGTTAVLEERGSR